MDEMTKRLVKIDGLIAKLERLTAIYETRLARMLTVDEVVERYGVSRSYIMRAIADQRWPWAVKEAGRWRFPVEEIERFFAHY